MLSLPPLPDDPALRDRLGASLAGRRHAELLAIAWDAPDAAPERLLDDAPPGAWGLYLASAQGLEHAGVGAAAIAQAEGPDRFEAIAQQTREVLGGLPTVDLRRNDARRALFPRFVGGFAFHDDPPDPALWGDFGAATFVLPARFEGRDPVAPWRGLVLPVGEIRAWLAGRTTAIPFEPPDERPDAGGWARHEARHPDYRELVRHALDAIESHDLHKIVLARSRTLPMRERPLPSTLIARLQAFNPGAWRYYFGGREGVAFTGATPERLVRVRGRSVESVALAGTAALPVDADDDLRTRTADALLASDKDRREHAYVVDAVTRALATCCDDVLSAAQPGTIALPGVMHLETPIQATLRDGVAPTSLVARLHPTPAVGGAPRGAALERIRTLEGGFRGWYAGAIGWIARDAVEFVVALRSALLHGDDASIFAGAGIVAGSSPDAELAETEAKMTAMRRALALEEESP